MNKKKQGSEVYQAFVVTLGYTVGRPVESCRQIVIKVFCFPKQHADRGDFSDVINLGTPINNTIRLDAAVELDKVVKLMTETYPEMVIRLESHTDPAGSAEYNDRLSARRAKSTYEYLVNNGVPKEHILSYRGYGERKPVNECTSKYDCSAEDLGLNRRKEFPVEQIRGKRSAVA
ncbi:hypothetical protein BST99_05600 [Aureicoccus marinus]|uniref:OmpA-like domain-containing protein n=1 Tax=Aureicoccus marinus TaxID=754435 RepID=A0A2S7T6Z0_9FLAO|nr:hypothetical protein BST99_05600 [Aureicoccus marinus]